jgi:hypothetical protein
MSRSNLPPRPDGHLNMSNANRDLEQKLTYQQLLNLNHDLSKENQQLKNISKHLSYSRRSIGRITKKFTPSIRYQTTVIEFIVVQCYKQSPYPT